MTTEDIIFRITDAIYNHPGVALTQPEIEALVLKVYKAVEPYLNSSERMEVTGAQRLIVSVFGLNRPGIVAAVSQVLAEAGYNISDINQTVVQGKFAMVLVADIPEGSGLSLNDIKERFNEEGTRLGVKIYAQREDLFHAMHRL